MFNYFALKRDGVNRMPKDENPQEIGHMKTKCWKELAEIPNKNPIILTIHSGREISLKGLITVGGLEEYEENLLKTKSSREAFVAMLVSLSMEENVSFEEISGLSDEELIPIGETYLERDKNLKEFYDKTNVKLSFYDRFEQTYKLQREKLASIMAEIIPDLSSISKAIQDPISRAYANLQETFGKLNFTSTDKEYLSYGQPLSHSIHELPKLSLSDFKIPPSPGYMTNELLIELLEEQRDNNKKNKDVQKSIAVTMKDMLNVQLELVKEGKESSKKSTRLNVLIIILTTLSIIVSVYQEKIRWLMGNVATWCHNLFYN